MAMVVLLVIPGFPVVSTAGTIAQVPLFVGLNIQPNIFFALDDSGSMNWPMPIQGAEAAYFTDILDYYDTEPDNYQGEWVREWNTWCRGANLLAYDQDIVYQPWPGNGPESHTPFPSMDAAHTNNFEDVWVNPRTEGAGDKVNKGWPVWGWFDGTVDLLDVPVIRWVDRNGNGVWDVPDCPHGYDEAGVVRFRDLSDEEKENFANWFTYYRTREFTTKGAVSRVVTQSSARMGLATLHNNNNVGLPIADMRIDDNKEALLDHVFNIISSGGTPLRRFLNNVGYYFSTTDTTPDALFDGDHPPSPILPAGQGGECQQNFVMLMTDGAWNGGSPHVGHQDRDLDIPYVYEAHRDNFDNTLADVAMRWYKRDLAPSIDGEVPTQTGDASANLDENSEQHLVTFSVAFGPVGTIDTDPSDRNAPFPWPEPTANAQETADDLRHAAYNGRGRFLSARDPVSLIETLDAVIADIESRQGSGAAVNFNSATLEAGSKVFVALFNSQNWSGDLVAYALDPDTGNLASTPSWSAQEVLDAPGGDANRVIYTMGADGDGALFQPSNVQAGSSPWPSALIQDLRTQQDQSQESSPYSESVQRVEFLRGDRTNEGALFRTRGSRLGDMVHSPPIYVGEPSDSWPDADPFGATGARYSDFVEAQRNSPRTPVVYVGANDGLLHGFNAENGEEVLAYAPGVLASEQNAQGYHYLTEKTYGHRYYVDGDISVHDVYMAAEFDGSRAWRTVAVVSMRGGGRGVAALDVTDPSAFTNTAAAAEDVVLWEFTSDDDADLGYTFSQPQITMMNNGKWAVVIGNGYNDNGSSGTAKLFILFMEEGLDGWQDGDYVVLDTGSGSTTDRNGLSTPALLDVDGDQVTDFIYAGDLHGDLWVFDVRNPDPLLWESVFMDPAVLGPAPLFDGDPTEPITMKPLLVRPDWVATTASNFPNVMVYFGTGQYLFQGDASTTDQQYFYGVWHADKKQLTRADLVAQSTLSDSSFPSDARILSNNSVTYADPPSGGDYGWYYPLPDSGERVVVDAFLRDGLVFFNTAVPTATACSAGGYSYLMSVDAQTGGNPDFAAFDFNADGKVDEQDLVVDSSDNDVAVAGQKFDYGLASASALLGDYQYTSGTNTRKPVKRLLRPAASAATGVRRSWIELTPQ